MVYKNFHKEVKRGQQDLLPSVLILRAVRTRANRVALNITVPSLFRGMFMETRR